MKMDGNDLDLLAFRHQLMRISEQLVSDEVTALTSLFTRMLSLTRRLQIKEGYELFAALEQKKVLTKDKYKEVLANLFQTIGQEVEASVTEFEKGMTESRKFLSLPESPAVSVLVEDSLEHLKGAYRQCLSSLSDCLAREDGSLQKMVYMCPQLPLRDLDRIKDGHTLFRKLEEKGLIRCWHLPYLYVCFQCS